MGIAACEDTRGQDAMREGWEAIDAHDFLDCS
jgi:hypothetical protein